MRLRYALLIVFCLLVPAGGNAQDWNITGAGARAEGFGGAFIGVADDATAIVWNPAGLGQLERMEASAVGRYVRLSGQPLPTVAPIIATVIWCVLFTAVAFWRIRREEF